MIKNEYLVYQAHVEIYRVDVFKAIRKQPESEWGKLILDLAIEKAQTKDYIQPKVIGRYDTPLDNNTLPHQMYKGKTPGGLIMLCIDMIYQQEIHTATDNEKWIAWRGFSFNERLMPEEIKVIKSLRE